MIEHKTLDFISLQELAHHLGVEINYHEGRFKPYQLTIRVEREALIEVGSEITIINERIHYGRKAIVLRKFGADKYFVELVGTQTRLLLHEKYIGKLVEL